MREPHESTLMNSSEAPPFLPPDNAIESALPRRLVVALALFDVVDLSLARFEPLGHSPAYTVVAALLPGSTQLERFARRTENKAAPSSEVVLPEPVAPRVVLERALIDVSQALESFPALLAGQTLAQQHALDARPLAACIAEGLVNLIMNLREVVLPPGERGRVAEEVVFGCEVLRTKQLRVGDISRDWRGQRKVTC